MPGGFQIKKTTSDFHKSMSPFKLFHPLDLYLRILLIIPLIFFASSHLLDFVLPMTFGVVSYIHN